MRVFETRPLQFACRCSDRKVERVLTALPEDELGTLIVDGKITVTCEFCNEVREYDRGQVAALRTS